jgi:hypothetical protein
MKNITAFLASCALVGSTCIVAACTTTSTGIATVSLDASKAMVTAQISFKTLQQVALAGVQSGAIKGPLKAQVIALVDKGQDYENRAYQAQQAGQSSAGAITALTDIVAQLNALGIKGN